MSKEQLTIEAEVWKTIDGFNGFYQVSNFGNVRSIDRTIFNHGCNANQEKKGVILKQRKDNGGYQYVIMYDATIGKRKMKTAKVHRLVAFYFCDGYEEGLHVNHKDGTRDNNHYTNLEWCTHKENMRHKYLLGYKNPSCEDGTNSKIKNEWIPIISRLYYLGVHQKVIAKSFNVSQSCISQIITNKTFKEDNLLDRNLALPIQNINS